MEGISFAYPAWYIVFCLLAGLIYALVLYYRDDSFRDAPSWLVWLLSALRFLAVSILSFLLLSPILRSVESRSQKPIVVLAQDGSESVMANWSAADSTAYVQNVLALKEQLGENYEFVGYTFGSTVRDTLDFSFGDKRTNLADLLHHVYDVYSNQNLGAVIISSDGIYNEGANPVYTNAKLNAPVYTLGLGDTTRRKDIVLKRVFHNKIAYLGDKFSIQVDINAQNAAGTITPLKVVRIGNGGNRELINESVNIDRNDFFTTREFLLDADQAGVNRYRITIGTTSGEASVVNNSRDIYVDVLEARQKVLILAHAPHPDLSALKRSISEGRNNEVEVAYRNSFSGSLRDYDLVILHQLPNRTESLAGLLQQLEANRTPVWFIAGEQSGLNAFNAAQQLVNISGTGRNSNEVEPKLSNSFSLFKVNDEVRELLPTLPPMTAPFGEFTTGANSSVLLYQRIGRIDTDFPLLALGDESGRRMAVMAGTGLWKWRLFDYLDRKSHDRFNELVSQVIQYLSVKDDKRRFRVSLAKNIFDENEPIFFDAELYNDNYELVNEPSAQLVITDAEGREYNYTFNATSNAYRLNAGILPVGNYRFRATVNTGTENLVYNGQFSVQAVQLERYEMTADHDLLRLLSERYGGELLDMTGFAALPQTLEERGTVKPVLYETVTTRSLVNVKLIFFLLLFLLSLEWFLRRYFGAY